MTDDMPKILIYTCDHAPPHLMIQGRFLASSRKDLQPICFTGADAPSVRGRMEDFWQDQCIRHAAYIERAKKARQAAKDRAARKASQLETHHD